jgi:hypothetical protein
VIRVIELGDSAFVVHQERHAAKAVLGDKLAVRFGRVSRESQDLNVSFVIFGDVLLKLNKLANSVFCVVLGIKGKDNGLIIF